MATLYNANNIRAGHIIEYEGEPYKVMNAKHITPGKGQAVMQIKMRNIMTGVQRENRFRATEQVKRIVLDTQTMEYLYEDGDMAHFMNNETFEQMAMPLEDVAEQLKFLLPNATVDMQLHNSRVIGVELPKIVELRVEECAPYIKGATVTNQTKPAVLETGLEVQVPGFIEPGQVLRIDTETGQYVERARD
ncbi:MAG: elongation factor P [Candidatus Lernaella stagnicola]|nr:elongation factor P [Candidatus Lernaella stagnicola]